MEPNARSEFVAISMETSPAEIRSFDEIVQLYWPRIFRFMLASVHDRHQAQDLTQDCFCKAYKGWRRFRGDSSVHTWLMRIAVNVVKDFARNRRLQFWRRAPSMDAASIENWLLDVNLSPEASLMARDNIRAIWEAVKSVSPQQRTAFLLRFVEGMEMAEIAAAMGITQGAVKVHLFRAVQAVRKRLRISK